VQDYFKMKSQYEVDPVHLEKAIMTVITGVSRNDWAQFTMGSLRARLNEFDVTLVKASDGEIVDCIGSLEKNGLIATRKNDPSSTYPFAQAQAEEDRYRHQFFWIGSFELKITHEGRKVLGHIEVNVADNIASSADEMDDMLPLLRRKVLNVDLPRLVKEALDNGLPLALVMVDIDKFKLFNDTHGHPIGDQVLIAVSTTIAKRAQGKGKAYRYGGEEIAVLLPNYSKTEACALAETIRVELERSRRTEKNLVVTASFGVGALPEDAQGGTELVQLADDALRSAKGLGRNLVRTVGDTNEVKQSSTPRRKQPAPGALSDEQQVAIRAMHFHGHTPTCPTDGTPLRVKEFNEMAARTPTLLVICPGCGMQEILTGA
jgi:diguanylate cyclase (GGDEF)-like protein